MLRGPLGSAARHLAQLPGFSGQLAQFKDKAYKLDTVLKNMSDPDVLYKALVTEWSAEAVPALSAPRLPTKLDAAGMEGQIADPVNRMMLLDGLTYLPDDILTKLDRAAMAVGLETRVPLLDHRVAEIAWRLPMSMKIHNGQGKWALRQILYKHVPKELVERPKSGFAIPVGQWLRGPLRDWAEALLSEARLKKEGYFDSGEILGLWRDHCAGRRDGTYRLWNVLSFQAWLSSQGEAP